jgi:hypothetical protein
MGGHGVYPPRPCPYGHVWLYALFARELEDDGYDDPFH